MRLVVDTSVLIDHLRDGMTWRNLVAKLKQETEFFIPTIVIYELYAGKSTKDPHILAIVQNLIKQFRQIGLDEEIARHAGELYRDTKKTLQVPDYIIAASCLSIGGTLLTLNTKHFQHIPGLALFRE